jgi:hypothetical protein
MTVFDSAQLLPEQATRREFAAGVTAKHDVRRNDGSVAKRRCMGSKDSVVQ